MGDTLTVIVRSQQYYKKIRDDPEKSLYYLPLCTPRRKDIRMHPSSRSRSISQMSRTIPNRAVIRWSVKPRPSRGGYKLADVAALEGKSLDLVLTLKVQIPCNLSN